MNCWIKANVDLKVYPGLKTVSVNILLNANEMANFKDWNIQFLHSFGKFRAQCYGNWHEILGVL
jgi:hypothetical protein